MKKFFASILFVLLPMMAVSAHPSRLYMVGDATTGGWSLDNLTLMVTESDGVYAFVGDLNAGELKFLETPDWMPSYGPATNGEALASGELTKRVEELEGNDNKFTVVAGRYSLKIDLTGETPQIVVADGAELEDKGFTTIYPEVIYAIGNATAADWSLDDAIVMNETACNSGIYEASLALKSGQVKFLHQRDWGKAYGAAVADTPVEGTGEYDLGLITDDSNDNKFAVSLAEETTFDVTVNAATNKLIVAPHRIPFIFPDHLYIIGPAVGGWSWDDNAQEMASEENGVYTWTGTLLGGEMKFFVEKDFGAIAFGATAANTEISATGEYDIVMLGEEDNKFIAPADEVTLTVDLTQMKLISAKETTSLMDVLASDGVTEVYDLTGAMITRVATADLNGCGLKSGIYILKSGQTAKKIIVR